MKKSMIEIAFQVVNEHEESIPFIELYKKVSKEMGFNETQFDDNIAQFYTDLSIDGRFLNLAGNNWDLKKRHTYSESVMDTDKIALDDEENEEEVEIKEE
ncbi:MAG: DNA-directed RNA polymerase subunit delta [Bacillota bacterium]|nr:DNA-directed RNA polymerase subunit delta [Bacillota bacterium]